MIISTLILVLLVHNAVASFKGNCLDLRNAQVKSTFLDDRCLSVDVTQVFTQADAQQQCVDQSSQHQQLAGHFDQTKINILIGSMIDLSNGVWTALLLTPTNGTVLMNNQTGQNRSISHPPWATGSPDPTKGPGILLRFDGLVNAQLDSKHPALCESFEKTSHALTNFKGGSKVKMSEAVMSTSTVTNQHQCGISCAEDPQCRAFAYGKLTGECQRAWLSEEAITQVEADPNYILMNREPQETNCPTPSDCLAPSDVPKLLLVNSRNGPLSFESYHPDQSSLAVLHNTTSEKIAPIAVLQDQKVVVASHFHNGAAGELTLASETFLYDPSTHAVSSAGSTVEPRHEPAAALLDQAVIMCGGLSSTSTAITSCESFSAGQWSAMSASLSVGRWAFEMVNLHNKLYALGGWMGSFATAVERFDPVTDAWTTLTELLPVPRFSLAATVFKDQIVMCGGIIAGSVATDDCHTFSDVTDKWTTMTAMTKARAGLVLTAFHGDLYAIAGASHDGSVEKFDPHTGQWSPVSDTILPGFAAAIVL